jgi:hypothetical protein
MPIIGETKVNNSQNSSGDIHNSETPKFAIPKHPVSKREHSSKVSWRDWEKNYNSSLLMSKKAIWETNFLNTKEKTRFSTEIKEMQSQKKINKCKTKKELDKVREEYARMMALSCVHKKFGFSRYDPLREEKAKLTKKNLEMFEESYKAHIRSRSRSESARSENSTKRQEPDYRLTSPNVGRVDKGPSHQMSTRSGSPSPGDMVNGIKGFNKLFPAIANKKPPENKKKIFSVTGSSVQNPKIRPQSDIPPSERTNGKKQLQTVNVSKITQQSLNNFNQTNGGVCKVQVSKQSKDKKGKFWINPQDFAPENEQEEKTKSSNPQILAPNSTTALMFAAYKQKFETSRQSHSEPPMRLRFMMRLREASTNLEPIPERPKSFMPEEFRSVHSSRQFLEKEVKKVLHEWSPSVQRRKETRRLLQATQKPVTVAREKTLSAIMRDFRVYVEQSRTEGRFPSIYKERYIFPDLE